MSVKIRALLVGLLTTTAVTAGASPASASAVGTMIVGGRNATQTYSFMVSLQNTSGEHLCGGSLIKANWVVTAKHCVAGRSPASVRARIGTTNRTSGGSLIEAAAFHTHLVYDVALVRLAGSVSQTPIAVAADSGAVGTATRIIGWGQTCPGASGCGPPVTLQELDTSIVADSSCSGITARWEICTGNPGGKSGACFGDSGGPQVKLVSGRWQLIGATSRPGGGAACGERPSIYMDVPAFRSWISGIAGAV